MTKLSLLSTILLLPTLTSSQSLASENIISTLPSFYPVKNVNKINIPLRLPPLKGVNRDKRKLFNNERQLNDDSASSCEQNWFNCIDDSNCNSCTIELDSSSIDYFTLPSSTTCATVLDLIYEQNVCLNLRDATGSATLFCNAFTSCIDDEGYTDDYGTDDSYEGTIDCDSLTECHWEGMIRNFLGDGVCDQWTVSGEGNCYNHKICGYDNGDCCEDKCSSSSDWTECGENGFFCRDPESDKCYNEQNEECPEKPPPIPPPTPVCKTGESLFRINEFDSFGDGWDSNKLVLKRADTNTEIYNGGLEDGTEG